MIGEEWHRKEGEGWWKEMGRGSNGVGRWGGGQWGGGDRDRETGRGRSSGRAGSGNGERGGLD